MFDTTDEPSTERHSCFENVFLVIVFYTSTLCIENSHKIVKLFYTSQNMVLFLQGALANKTINLY